jgi:hypothetical protein
MAAGPDCRSCHAYPPADTNHSYHLFHTHYDKAANGLTTCLDCHSTALAKAPVTHLDTLYFDDLNEWSSLDFPIEAGKTTFADTIRTFAQVRVDTIHHEHPVPAPARPGGKPLWEEYVTSLAHMNGKVDVVFHPRLSDRTKFKGSEAAFNPERETCSAVACHPGVFPLWRFADSARGLSRLVGDTADLP